ncbi:DUF5631 domain-containing protein [Mycobacterium ostraviense]|nr:DUF5631 domain-containing protein [Mycobacterium ostraviense]UGT93404.1 DUF5631 domain-containing protein [Mycobacterium ostraviense]
MPADLPPGKWSMLLVGAWWPARPDSPAAGVSYWSQAGKVKREEASDLQNTRSQLAVNKGRTATDLLERYWRGEQRVATIAHQCQVKSEQSDLVADAVNNLRDRLSEIAKSGNAEIDRILSGNGPTEAKVAAVNAVIVEKNASASHAGANAISNIVDATQRVLDATIGGDARKWLRDHGVNLDGPPPPQPVTAEDLGSPPAASAERSTYGAPRGSASTVAHGDAESLGSPIEPAYGGPQGMTDASLRTDIKPPASPPGPAYGGPQGVPGAPSAPIALSPQSPPGAPAFSIGSPSIPAASAPATGVSAAAAAPLSPQSLSQSFTTGMMTGAPAAAGAQSLSEGTIHAATEPLAPTTPPATTPMATTPAIATGAAAVPHVPDMSAAAAPTPVVSPTTETGMTTVAPVVAGGPTASPIAPVSAPAGPLPAYGSDLRPPVITPPTAAPAGPVSGAAVAPSPSSSPAAGASMMSPVAKSTSQAAHGQTPSAASPLAGATVTATVGATTGDAANRSAEQQRLRRFVDAMARQEPNISWAAGLRDGGRTTLLVTDLAGGWIPPHVRLPAHVTLLEPAPRRHDANVEDLLGAVSVAAVHQPHGYIGEPEPDEPALTGDRTARTAPTVDELGPTLVEAVRRRDGLPRIAQAVAIAAARKYGVPDNEVELLHERATEIQQSVLSTYPHHDAAAVVDWMLLAAINALIEGNHSAANYHLAWAIAVTSTRRGT